MKKTFYALFALLLVLMLATCDDSGGTPSDQTVPEGMVKLSISVDDGIAGKALTTALAKSGINYYEAVFFSGDAYQAEWDPAPSGTPTNGTITIPKDDYATASGVYKAILFGGRKVGNDYVLLAVGELTKVDNGSGLATGTIVGDTTTAVSFLMTALNNEVVGSVKANSRFKITGPSEDKDNEWNFLTAAAGAPATVKVAAGTNFPVFPVPAHGYTPTADTKTVVKGQYNVDIPHNEAVILRSPWTATPSSSIVVGTGPEPTTSVGLTPVPLTAATKLDANCVLDFTIDLSNTTVTDKDGLCAVSIEVPVYALRDQARKQPNWTPASKTATIPWVIRNGYSPTTPLTPDDGSNTGTAILLDVGFRYGNFTKTVSITNPDNTGGGTDWTP